MRPGETGSEIGCPAGWPGERSASAQTSAVGMTTPPAQSENAKFQRMTAVLGPRQASYRYGFLTMCTRVVKLS
jgi:hypothetical protein